MCNVGTLFQVICLNFVVIISVQSVHFPLSNITRIRRQSNGKSCPKPQFACTSGECINGDLECDGAVDCKDASDESSACRRIKCPPFLFTCNYGACINKEFECDGKSDCRDGSDENTPSCKTNIESSSTCNENEFRCSSGQCISEDDKCDGKAECTDHSDEIKATCWNVRCPGYTYKCDYGACVNGRAKCNGVIECFDGSDEDPRVCKTSPATPNVTTTQPPPIITGPVGKGYCILPSHPNLGKWSIIPSYQPLQPGTPVPPGTTLKIECNNSYKLNGSEAVFCEAGRWSSSIGHCLKTCKPRVGTATMQVTCIYKNNRETNNCTDAVDGTLAKFKCAPFYEDLNLNKQPVHICKDGDWDQPYPHCTPVCGQKTGHGTPLIISGANVTRGEYPWQVAIYVKNSKVLICGGSLISQRTVLTAAHCVTDLYGTINPKDSYVVAVGKYYTQFDDKRDHNDAQFSELLNIFVAEDYRGDSQNFRGDIAVLITVKKFALSTRVQPVCIDRGGIYNRQTNQLGYVTGWGFTEETGSQSEVLKELKVPAVDSSECYNSLPEGMQRYHTSDKFCAGYLQNGTSVCSGDSGGPLVFKYDGRYYVNGIVSVSPTSISEKGGCSKQHYSLYTDVSKYINTFILQNKID